MTIEAGFYRTFTNNKAEVVAQNSEGQWVGIISHDNIVIMPALWTAEGFSTGGNAHGADNLTEVWVDPAIPEPDPNETQVDPLIPEPEPEPENP